MMNKGGACVMTSSGGSSSPTSSSGAPSSSSIGAEGDEKDFIHNQFVQNSGNQLMQMLLQQQQQKTGGNNGDLSSIMDMFSNGNSDLAKLAAQIAQQSKTQNETEGEELRESSPSPPPAVSLNSTLAAMVLPTTSTSTGCSAASTTSSVDSATSSVIVNGHVAPQTSATEDDEPSAKRVKTEEETPVTPTNSSAQFMQLLAQMGGLSGSLPQQNQKQLKESQEMMLGQFFPQSLGLPLMFPSSLHQQFSGMQDFDALSALSTYSSNGKNYCDICNKEVCNKYFLRTHMLKMHGIVIDENKTVIANIDTSIKEREGELTFRCDTCRTMFNTRNQLRQHRQDVHGVLPLSTPRNNQNKPSVPSTPTAANNNSSSGPNSASLADEKCQMCDKRFSATMMPLHMVQEHIGQVTGGVSNGTPDLSHVLSMLNQAAQGRVSSKSEEKELGSPLLKCGECDYKTSDSKNLDLHLERHYKMTDAKNRVDDDEDVALKLTTEAALHMVNQNQNQFDGDSSAAALNLTFKNDGVKKENEEERAARNQNHERNSHTFQSGSISPSGSIPEVFGSKVLGEKVFSTQNFLIRCNDECGEFLTEFLAQLPVRSVIDGPRKIVFDLLPAPTNP
uniref:C2H2-type domain-containing protein n=1 Tax=Caenorhabditis tropicalis TaxID=1561998 RepID=A0A1I7UCJ0_9PELO